MAQSIEHLTLGLGPGHDLGVVGSRLWWGSLVGMELLEILFLTLPLLQLKCALTRSLSLK